MTNNNLPKIKIVIGADHAGFSLKEKIKEFLIKENYKVIDEGTFSKNSCDYPGIAEKVAKKVNTEKVDFGILFCGTGVGMSIAANKIKGIRAAHCQDTVTAYFSRAHNNANILTLGARILGEELVLEIIKVFLNTKFEKGRHLKRVEKIKRLED